MEKTLETMAATSPGLVAAVIIVILFMKHLAAEKVTAKELHEEHLDQRKLSRAVIEENAKAMKLVAQEMQHNADVTRRNTEAIDNLSHVIKEKL